MPASNREKRDFRFKLAGALLVGIALFAAMPLQRMMRAENDFVHWYVGGTLFGTDDLHSQTANYELQKRLIGGVLDDSYFIRPTFYGLLLKPLTWFPYLTAYWIYQFFSLAVCTAWSLRQWARQWPDVYVFAAMSLPLLSNFVNGQDVTTLLLLCTISLFLARRGHDFAAGLVFSLCAIKFHLFILTPFAMIFQKRWRMFWGAAAGEVALFLAGLAFGGWKVFLSLVALLSQKKSHPYPELMPNLRGMLVALFGTDSPGSGIPALLAVSLVVGIAVLYLAKNARGYEEAFAYCLMGGMIMNFHSYIQDPLLLLMIAAILFRGGLESAALGMALRLTMFPVVYILLMSQAPWSAAYTLMILLTLGIAVRDHWRPRPQLEPAAAA
jgi:Glycosyltransferase family 87